MANCKACCILELLIYFESKIQYLEIYRKKYIYRTTYILNIVWDQYTKITITINEICVCDG